MKNFTLAPEVEAKVHSLIKELHDLCSTHRIPYVNCVITGNSEISQQKRLSVLINTDEGLADNSLIAAAELLKMLGASIPDEVVAALIEQNSAMNAAMNGGECNCPKCQARREGLAEVKPDGAQLH